MGIAMAPRELPADQMPASRRPFPMSPISGDACLTSLSALTANKFFGYLLPDWPDFCKTCLRGVRCNLSQKLHCIRVNYKNTFAVGGLQERRKHCVTACLIALRGLIALGEVASFRASAFKD